MVDPAKLAVLHNAEIITLNIGGNNVLGPMIALVNQTAADLGIDLASATPIQLMQLIGALQNVDFSQQPEFAGGMSAFTADFPQIIAWLRTNAPGAKIIVSTVYNPITQVVGTNVFNASEQLIGAMNALILQGQMAGSVSNYAIADTFTAFKLASAPVTNFNPIAGSIDIHPNADGHTLMAPFHLEAYLAQIPVVTAAALPNGLTLNANTGMIAGTPTDAGSTNFTVNVWNAAGSAKKSLNITIDPAASYDISLSSDGTHTFPAQNANYDPIAPHSVIITNTGNQPTGALTVSLSGANPTGFTLPANNIGSIAVGGYSSFTVKPNDGLTVGTYTAAITVSGGNGISAVFNVSFSVMGICGVTVSESGSITAKDVTVTLIPPQSGVPVLFVAAYDGAGRMTALETSCVESNAISATMNLSGAVTIKAMMWEKSTYYPLCGPKTIKWINGEWK